MFPGDEKRVGIIPFLFYILLPVFKVQIDASYKERYKNDSGIVATS